MTTELKEPTKLDYDRFELEKEKFVLDKERFDFEQSKYQIDARNLQIDKLLDIIRYINKLQDDIDVEMTGTSENWRQKFKGRVLDSQEKELLDETLTVLKLKIKDMGISSKE